MVLKKDDTERKKIYNKFNVAVDIIKSKKYERGIINFIDFNDDSNVRDFTISFVGCSNPEITLNSNVPDTLLPNFETTFEYLTENFYQAKFIRRFDKISDLNGILHDVLKWAENMPDLN